MCIFKTFLVSAALAASTLGFVAVSGPAHACATCGGIKLNGTVANGLNWNGITWNGMKVNGIQFNGAQQTGNRNEAATVRVLAVTLPH